MIPVEDLPQRCMLFNGIAAENVTGLLDCLGARRVTCAKGDVILPEGAPARDVGVLLSGRIQLIRTDYGGNRSIVLSVSPGQLFAEAFACAKAERLPVSVMAAEDCETLLLDCRRLLTFCCNACEFHSRIIFNLLQIVAKKNLALHRKALVTGRRTTREKLLTYLLLQARETGERNVTVPFDRQGLADYLEVDRSGLSAVMSRLKKEGVLDYDRNHFRLLRVREDDCGE